MTDPRVNPAARNGGPRCPDVAVIAERVARFRGTNDPAVLWPDVTARGVAGALRAITRAAATVLDGAPDTPAVLELPSRVGARPFGVAAFLSGMGPLLGYWMEHDRLRLSGQMDEIAELLAAHLEQGRRRAARLRDEADRVLAACAARGVEMALLKGAHTAFSHFPDPGTRPMADLDLLVPPAALPAARAVLTDLGYAEINTDALPHRSDWALPGTRTVTSLDLHHVDNPWSLELHGSLDRMYAPGVVACFGPLDLGALPLRAVPGPPARVLPQPLLLAYLACHVSSHFASLPLLRLAELVLVARRDCAAPHAWSAVEALLARTGTAGFAYPALVLTERFVPGTVPAPLLERLAPAAPRAVRRRLARTTPATAQRFGPYRPDYAPMWAATARQRWAYFLHLVWPGRPQGPLAPRAALARQRGRVHRLLRTLLRQRG